MIDYNSIIQELKDNSDEDYKSFNEGLIPGGIVSYGVRVPYLRKMAQRIARDTWLSYLKMARDDSQEEKMLQGLVIGYAKCLFEEKLEYIRDFIPKIDNWAICDTVCSGLKDIKKNLPRFLEFLQPYMASDDEYRLRFAIVCLMDYYITDEYIDMTLDFMAGIQHEAYYVRMAAAWGLSVCFVKYRDRTIEYFTENKIRDSWINNKAIQKIRESYRAAAEDKKLLLNFKR